MAADLNIVSPLLNDFVAYWRRKKGDRLAPSRREFTPEEMPVAFLPHIYMFDVLPGPPRRFRFRLVGTAVVKEYGGDPTGKFADEVDMGAANKEIIAEYDLVVTTGQPVAAHKEFTKEDGRKLVYERVMLPLSDDGKNVNILLGAMVATGVG